MKKSLTILILLSLSFLPTITLGQDDQGDPEDLQVFRVLNNILRYLFGGLLAFAVIMLVVAGYMFISSAGDPEKYNKAKWFVVYALIGVLVGFMSRGLVAMIREIVGEPPQ